MGYSMQSPRTVKPPGRSPAPHERKLSTQHMGFLVYSLRTIKPPSAAINALLTVAVGDPA
jgi:hypothetical protein